MLFEMSVTHGSRATKLRRAGLTLGIVGVVADFPASFLSCMAAFQAPWSLELGYVAFSWLSIGLF